MKNERSDGPATKTGMTLLPTGDANFWRLMEDGRWIAVIQFNGELMEERQVEIGRRFCASDDLVAALEDMMVCYRDEKDKTNVDRRAFAASRAAIAKTKGP